MPLKRRWRHRRTTSNLDTWEPDLVDQPVQQPTRRYLAETTYLLPKDDTEGDRLHFQHHALFQVLGNYYVAPLGPSVRTILDGGTGTGIWAREMAQVFPQALVVGLDLDPALLRETPALPAHCLLRVGDVCKGLPFPERFFSYTHQRLLVYVIPRVEYGPAGRSVVICPRHGVLLFEPDTPPWFAWVTQQSSFRFLGRLGHFTAHHEWTTPRGAWRAHRQMRTHSYNLRLAPNQHLTTALLEQAAQALQAHLTWLPPFLNSAVLSRLAALTMLSKKCHCSVFIRFNLCRDTSPSAT